MSRAPDKLEQFPGIAKTPDASSAVSTYAE